MRRSSLLRAFVLVATAALVGVASAETADKQAILERGIAEKNNNELDAAITDFGKAIALDPKWAAPYEYRGATLAAKFEATEDPSQVADLLDKAIADYDAVIKLGAASARTYTLRGTALSDREDFKLAIADFDRALAIDPKFELAVRSREFAADQLREQIRSIGLVGDMLRFQPRNLDLLLTHAGLLARAGRRDEAVKDLDNALEIDPKNEAALAQRDALKAGETAKP